MNSAFSHVVSSLHDHDPFLGFDASSFELDLQGWHSQHPVLQQSIASLRPNCIIEVGVWKGGSTIFMAEQLRSLGIAGGIIAVDTFLGSSEHLLNPELKPLLMNKHGQPQLYQQFLANVMHRDLTRFVCPFPQTSRTACTIFRHFGIRPAIVHIDASHDYVSVKEDLENYFELLQPGGALIGDDFNVFWPEVVWAATEFSKNHRLQLQHADGKFILLKPR